MRIRRISLLLPLSLLLAVVFAAGQESVEIERITVEELKAKLEKNEAVAIIDVRSQSSYDATDTKIKGAIRIPLDEIESRAKEIPRDREIITYCT